MTDGVLIATALLVAAPLYAATTFVLAHGARSWADATAAVHRARAHGYQADADAETMAVAVEAAQDAGRRARAPHRPPEDEEILAAIRAERGSTNGKVEAEYTTLGNEGIEDQEPIRGGGFYNTAGLDG